MSNIEQYLPNIYNGILETDCLMAAENSLFDQLTNELVRVENNEFIPTADSHTISQYENILGIVSNSMETLEFRRQRVLNRLSTDQVFTMKSLETKLNQIIGAGAWKAYIDPEEPYTLVVESLSANQSWYHELLVTINNAKPANIVFINKPLTSNKMDLGESISYTKLQWNYRLGISWELGRLPFSSLYNVGEIKSMSTPSVKQAFLNDVTTYNLDKIVKARINGEYVVTTLAKTATDNTLEVEYSVPQTSGLAEINKIELLDSENIVLTEALVYIPVLTDIILKHALVVTEG